ncbi:MAG: endo-1,4-beta-xylanase, partial [Myxococcales bacterium]|nr:endo-1,4-beta-xylanase [Myxococcales bacterium]
MTSIARLTPLLSTMLLAVACGTNPSAESSGDAGSPPSRASRDGAQPSSSGAASSGAASSGGSSGGPTGASSSSSGAGSSGSGSGASGGSSSGSPGAADGGGAREGGGTADAGATSDGGAAGGDGASDSGSGGPSPIPVGHATTLRAGAEALGRLVGVAFNTTHTNEAAYGTTAGTEFDFVTPENEMKWAATEPSQGQFTFTAGDAVV